MEHKKILHLIPTVKTGGGILRVLDILNNDNFNSHFIISSDINDEFIFHTNKVNGFYNCNLRKVSIISIFYNLSYFLKVKPDIIHCHGKSGAFYAIFLKLVSYKTKVVYTLHGFNEIYFTKYNFLYLKFERLCNLLFNCIICVSESEFFKYSKFISKNKTIIVYNGIQVSRNVYIPFEKFKHVNHKNIVIVSRLSKEKDLLTGIKFFEKLKLTYPLNNDKLYIVGDTKYDINYFNTISDYITKNKINDIIFLNEIKDVKNYLHYFDLLISTSLNEGLPSVIIESNLNKTFVISSNCSGSIDIVFNNYTGLLFKIGNFEELFFKYVEYLEMDISQKRFIITNAYNFASKYNIDNYINSILSIYNSKKL